MFQGLWSMRQTDKTDRQTRRQELARDSRRRFVCGSADASAVAAAGLTWLCLLLPLLRDLAARPCVEGPHLDAPSAQDLATWSCDEKRSVCIACAVSSHTLSI